MKADTLLGMLFASFLFGLNTLPSLGGELHIVHCIAGCPKGTPESNDLVVREIFSLSSNDDTKFADWVAYRVTSSTIGTSKDLQRGWEEDHFLENEETLEEDDYTGAYSAYDYNRGHQAPLAAFAGTVYWRQTNILSNITPQKGELNQGAWQTLEEKVRDAAYRLHEVYVVTGPLYEREVPALPGSDENHAVPSGYWKVVTTKDGRMMSFIFDQDTPRDANHCDHQAVLGDIESRSGLDLFPQEPAWPKTSLDRELGC